MHARHTAIPDRSANVHPPSLAVDALAAWQARLNSNVVSGHVAVDLGANSNDNTGRLMAHDCRPAIGKGPATNSTRQVRMHVRTADAAGHDPDENAIGLEARQRYRLNGNGACARQQTGCIGRKIESSDVGWLVIFVVVCGVRTELPVL